MAWFDKGGREKPEPRRDPFGVYPGVERLWFQVTSIAFPGRAVSQPYSDDHFLNVASIIGENPTLGARLEVQPGAKDATLAFDANMPGISMLVTASIDNARYANLARMVLAADERTVVNLTILLKAKLPQNLMNAEFAIRDIEYQCFRHFSRS